MTDIAELERRVTALEAAQNDTTQTLRWVVAKLGRIAAVQEEHTLRLDRIDGRLDEVETRLDKVEAKLERLQSDFSAHREELPGLIAETMREVLAEKR